MARPLEYSTEVIDQANEYLKLCEDTTTAFGTKVRIPTKGGLAFYLDVSRETLYAWAKIYPAFSDIMEKLGSIQEERLINNGLSGTYNSTIAKVLLTKHGYRDGMELTGNDGKDLIPDEKSREKADKALNGFIASNSKEQDTKGA